jgi:hypothetical protein
MTSFVTVAAGALELPAVSSTYSVIAYRGAMVASRDGWIADLKSRGGILTKVPGGFFHDIDAARFGSAAPLVYELPPLWLMVWMVPDLAADEIRRFFDEQGILESAENQITDVANVAHAVKNVGAGAGAAADLLVKFLPWLIYILAIGAVVYVVAQLAGAARVVRFVK